jgi:hypothetical protein
LYRLLQQVTLILAALFAVFWAILRACVQSLTIDESLTYTMFVNAPLKTVWVASSNNHILNTLLMWMTTHLFGNSSVIVRMPALMGAVLYIFTCYFLCRAITDRFSLRLALLTCLTFNPLIFDFMVAARGYGLANALLLAAIAVPVWRQVKGGPSLIKCCVWASLALGLSFTAQFSYAFVDLAAFLAIFIWAIQRREGEPITRIAAASVLPGLLAAVLLCGVPLMHWNNQDSLGPGAHSLTEMAQRLAQDSLYQLDPRSAASGWYRVLDFLKPLLLPILGLLCFLQLVVTRLDGSWLQDARGRWLGRLASALAGIVLLSVLMHWLSFRFHDLPLPTGRKGIYLVSLCTLVAGIIAAAPARSWASKWLGCGITTVFVCVACYLVFCLRLTYFQEWQWDADVKDVYPVLARYNHAYGVTEVGTSWYYVAALNYYRVRSNRENFSEFKATLPDPPLGESVYVMNQQFEREFLEREKLVVVYRGKSTDVVVAVRPGGVIPAAIVVDSR